MKSQKGFGLIPVLLILILVSVVGATGYYVYNQQTNKKTDKSEVAGDATIKASATPTPTANAVTPTALAAPTTNTQKYLVIKEWGVKVPLTDEISDLKYVNHGDYLTYNSSKLVELSGGACNDPNVGYLGFLHRTTDGDKLLTDKPIKESATKIDQYYYYYWGPGENKCLRDDNQGITDYFEATYSKILNSSFSIKKL